ncbi:hypothetical protein [Streptomyces sp. SP18BB07]|uniref:hypothetical protein n=1 Tax=Streptomyces sp. SP18BB07 TaxID=3002522 RepID=UPI002E7A9EDF|nr:hypothetical protein [Streptomyces sp. SP18BB07]MEE1764391.1 hypothetical protein [Streptomyces sp. SP18BB07]
MPYVTAWDAEAVRQPKVVRRIGRGGEGIGFEDENPVTDRRHEALWVRSALAQGCGTPNFRGVNSPRQKRAMRYSLCQICGLTVLGPGADEPTLHLLGGDTPILEGETTAAPPLHAPCAVEAIENCPPLGRGWAAALVDYSPLWGVAGEVYDRETLKPLPIPEGRPGDLTYVSVNDEKIRWTLASFTAVSLHGVTPVSMNELRVMAAEDARRAATGATAARL